VEVISPDGAAALTTSPIAFTLGDTFLYTTDIIQLIYHDKVLDYNVTHLKQKREHFSVRNAGTEDIQDVTLTAAGNGMDSIEFSFDEVDWSAGLYISTLAAGEERVFTVRITYGVTGSALGFRVGHFEIIIS
jgi:hypothetical protein